MRCIQSSASGRQVSIQGQGFEIPIKTSLQPSVKEILLHLVIQRGKSSHVKSSILLAPSAELDEDG